MRFPLARRHALAVLVTLAAVDGAILVVACSSSTSGFSDDAGGVPTGDDGGVDGSFRDSGPNPGDDSGKQGNCTVVKGACDLVLQDCPNDAMGKPQECIVTNANVTACAGQQASEQLPKGHACCPAANNPCLPGLQCIGNACQDGGPQTGRCAPACCTGDDTSCGASDPEGIAGACDLTIVDDNENPLFNVCSYRERCKPFGVEPCKAGEACLVDDKTGASSCIETTGLDAGSGCTFANDCADGLICAGDGDAGSCLYECLVPGSVSPFDAGLSQGAPGQGGCPGGSAKCNITFDPASAPAWLGACSP